MVAPTTPTAVACAAEALRTRTECQSQAVVVQIVFQPLPWLSQIFWPPATQWSMFVASAMKLERK